MKALYTSIELCEFRYGGEYEIKGRKFDYVIAIGDDGGRYVLPKSAFAYLDKEC